MGYTHYVRKNNNPGSKEKAVAYKRALIDMRRFVGWCVVHDDPSSNKRLLCDAWGAPGTFPAFGTYVAFNGNVFGQMAAETFFLPSRYKDLRNTFCKTYRQPYDVVVTACLFMLKYNMGDFIDIDSDGIGPNEIDDEIIAGLGLLYRYYRVNDSGPTTFLTWAISTIKHMDVNLVILPDVAKRLTKEIERVDNYLGKIYDYVYIENRLQKCVAALDGFNMPLGFAKCF